MMPNLVKCSLNVFLFALILLSGPLHASFQRAWTIQYAGKKSIVLGTEHGISMRREDLPPELIAAISSARKVMLETYPFDAKAVEPDLEDLAALGRWNVFLPRKGELKKMLSTGALRVLRNLLSSERYQVSLSMRPGALAYMITMHMRAEMDSYKKKYFREMRRADPSVASQVQAFYRRFEPNPALSEMLAELAGERLENLSADLLSEESTAADDREFIGVDRLVAQIAEQGHREITGLHSLEPQREDHELMSDMVDATDLNRLLMSVPSRIDPRFGEIYFFESLISNKMFSAWYRRLYFSDLPTQDIVAKIESLYEGLLGDFESLPGLEKYWRYIQDRHKFWVQTIAQEARQGNLVVAVGFGHLVDTSEGREPSLLEALRRLGFIVTPWPLDPSCAKIIGET